MLHLLPEIFFCNQCECQNLIIRFRVGRRLECVEIPRGGCWIDRPLVGAEMGIDHITDQVVVGLITEAQITGDQITNLVMGDVGIHMETVGLIIGLIDGALRKSRGTGTTPERFRFPSK